MVPQHGSFSLHTMLEGPRLHNMAFPTPMVRPLDENQGSSPLQDHGSWLMCEAALNDQNGVPSNRSDDIISHIYANSLSNLPMTLGDKVDF